MTADLVSVFQQNVHTVVVTHELGNPSSEGIWLLLELIDPVACIDCRVLRGLSSPWMLKMSSLNPYSLGQDLYMGRVLVAR